MRSSDLGNLPAFDPESPADIAADIVRKALLDIAIRLQRVSHYRQMPTHEQIEAFAGGALTGMMCVLFAHIQSSTESHDEIEKFVTSYVKQARHQAEAIDASGEPQQ